MKVAAFSDSPVVNTGYGRDVRSLLLGLKQRGHEVLALGIQHIGPPIEAFPGLRVYQASNVQQIAQVLKATHPDVLLHVRDNWSYLERFQRPGYDLIPPAHMNNCRVVSMTPIQSAPVPRDLVDTVKMNADLTIVQAEWEREQLIAQGAPADALKVLMHGVDTDVFHPGAGDRKAALLPDGKMLLTVASNTDRKNLPGSMLLLKKYLAFAEADPSTFLYLHSPAGHFFLDCHAEALGLAGKGKVFVMPQDEGNPVTLSGTDEESLANLYRTADVYVAPTFSEGFGAPILEALASGLPAVITDTPILRELYEPFPGASFMPAKKEMPTTWGMDWFPDTDVGAHLVSEAIAAGREQHVDVPEKFLWQNIVATLEGYLTDLCRKTNSL